MKTSIFTLTISSAAAFSPVAKNTVQSTTQLNLGYISGPEGGLKHKPFGSPGHFETIGDKSDAGRTADYNADSLAHKPFGAPGHFETFGEKSNAGRTEDFNAASLAHKPFGSPGHLETYGDRSDAGRTADYNAASLAHKPFGSPGHIETFGEKSNAGREVTNGEEIHHGRSSYAPVKNYQHVCGEIGYEETELSSAMVSPTYSAPAQSYAPGSWSPN